MDFWNAAALALAAACCAYLAYALMRPERF